MKLIVEVVVDVHPLESDVRVDMKDAYTALTQGIGEALRQAEHRGFNHDHSDWVELHIDTVDVSSAPILRRCCGCKDSIQVGKQGRAYHDEWYCDKCAEELPEAPDGVSCKFCDILMLLGEAHRHADGWVCASCWDERLRVTE